MSFDERLRTAAAFAGVLSFVVASSPSEAVVVQQAESVSQNTSQAGPPPAEAVAAGWLGRFGGFLVTAVGPHHVLAAAHIGGAVGSSVVFDQGPNAGTYTAVASSDDPAADLRLWEIDGTLSSWAPLYDDAASGDEVGQTVTIFGRGAPAGAALVLPNLTFPFVGDELKGWLWGSALPSPPNWSWGRNVVSNAYPSASSGPVLEIAFDRGTAAGAPAALPNECHLSAGDSSGPWFIDDGSGPALAGVTSAVLGPFRESLAGLPFNAMLLDYGGLYLPGAVTPFFDGPGPGSDFPSTAVGVQVAARLEWLEPLVAPPAPDTDDDGIPDSQDLCTALYDPAQVDTDGDGFGNACDCDFNQDFACNISDFNVFLPDFQLASDGGTGTDMNADGAVNISDFNFFLPGFIAGVPGPSVTPLP